MPALGGPVAVSAILLVIAGASKVWRPENTVGALRALRLPAAPALVRLLAVCELAIGVAAVVIGNGFTALLLAISYFGFACFVLLAIIRGGPLSSCGCFGTPDTPPTVIHVVMTLAACAVAAGAVVHPVGDLISRLADEPMAGLPFLALTVCSVWCAYAVLAVLPKSFAYFRGGS